MGHKGMTLLEIVIAMAIVALISSAIFGAFVFSRRISWRSESELRVAEFSQRVTEQLRSVVNQTNTTTGSGLSLNAGLYVNPGYDKDPNTPDPTNPLAPYDDDPSTEAIDPLPLTKDPCGRGATPIQALTIPEQLRRFNTRVICYVEDHLTKTGPDQDSNPPTCNDPPRGRDFNGDGQVDLRWARVVVDWDPPQQ